MFSKTDALVLLYQGRWAEEDDKHVRHVKWNMENPRAFVDKLKNKPTSAIVEHVRDGSTVRAFLLPDFHYVTLMVSGIRVSNLFIPC